MRESRIGMPTRRSAVSSLRTLISALVTVAVVAAVVGCTATATTASSHLVSIPAGELGGSFTTASTGSAEHVLASVGVATVADETSKTPVAAVTGSTGLTFTAAQVRAMTLEAADHGGISGATLDATASLPANYPPFAYLLAAWIKDAKTPGAIQMRKVMGAQNWTDAPTIVFPTIALPLFTADVISSLPAPTSQPSGLGAGSSANAGLTTEAAAVRLGTDADVFTSACSSASGFIQGVLNSVVTALQFSNPGTGGVGGFFKTVWNGAIGLAQQAIQGIVSAISGPVLGAIKTVAGTAAVVAQIVSYLKPWSVKVTADPATVNAGSGGTLTAKVDTGTGGADYPSAVKDCANAIGVTLPALTAANAKGTWDVAGAITTNDATAVTLDDHSASSISFNSDKSDSGATCDSAGQPEKTGTAKITVTRPDTDGLKQLVTSLLTNGLGAVGSVIGPVVSAIVSPMFDLVLGTISSLTDVSGSVTVAVIEPSTGSESGCGDASKASNTPEPTKEPTASCLVGTWRATNVTMTVQQVTLTGLVGATWTFDASGKTLEDYNGASNLNGATYSGIEIATFVLPPASQTSGRLLESAILGSSVEIASHAVPFTPFQNANGVGTPIGTYSCSASALTLNITGEFLQTWSFVRASK
jgi:hypothetical protein